MKGNEQIIEVLNEVLTGELTAVNQYFIHAKMCGNWGYMRLHKQVRAESIDEMRHAETLIDRILYLEGVPNIQRYWKVQIGPDGEGAIQRRSGRREEGDRAAQPRRRACAATCRSRQP